MIPHPPTPDDVVACVKRLYADSSDRDVPFEDVLSSFPGIEDNDEVLGDAIDTDARLRKERGLPISLERYLDAIPDLPILPIALDAAIEFTLRELSGWPEAPQSVPRARSEAAVEHLVGRFPSLEMQIRGAAMLNEAILATGRVQRLAREVDDNIAIPLPMDYGPELPDGRLRYELRTRLGGGGYGAVYLAVDQHLSDEARPAYTAVKILRRTDGDTRTPSIKEEALRARRVEHPNVVRVLDRGVDDYGRDYVVYEYVDGPSLRDWLDHRTSPPSAREAALLMAQVAHGVQAAHAAGVVHCDLKPENVLMARPPRDSAHPRRKGELDVTPKVADFGLAVCLESVRAASQHAPPRQGSGEAAVVCSLSYVAPEQFRGEEGALTPQADVYALGGILYHLLTGRLPNGQSSHDAKRNLRKVDGEEPCDRRGLRFEREIDPDLEAICRRALALDARDRYSSAEALAQDLESWLRREPIRWNKPGVLRRVRLYAARQPAAIAMLIALILIAATAGAGAVRLQMRAEHRIMMERWEAAHDLEAATAEWKEKIDVLTASMLGGIRRLRAADAGANFLSSTVILESMLGPELFREAEDLQIWNSRIDIAREVIERSRHRSRPDFHVLLWETSLGFWLLNDGQYAEAQQILAQSRASWKEYVRPDDPWLHCLELLQACAIAREHLARQAPPAESRGWWIFRTSSSPAAGFKPDEELLAAVRILQREPEVFTGTLKGGAAHRAVLRTLHDLYAPHFLNEPHRQRDVASRYRDYASW